MAGIEVAIGQGMAATTPGSKSAVNAQVMRLSEVPNGGVYKMKDGSILIKLRNPTLRPLQDVNSAPGWAADLGNGQVISTMWQGETVEFLGHGYKLARDTMVANLKKRHKRPFSR